MGFATLLEPVFAALLASVIFGEAMGATTLLGGLLILAAIGFSLKAEGAAEARLPAAGP